MGPQVRIQPAGWSDAYDAAGRMRGKASPKRLTKIGEEKEEEPEAEYEEEIPADGGEDGFLT